MYWGVCGVFPAVPCWWQERQPVATVMAPVYQSGVVWPPWQLVDEHLLLLKLAAPVFALKAAVNRTLVVPSACSTVPLPAPLWQAAQVTPFNARCLAWAPARLGAITPVGPDGKPPWHDTQVTTA